MQRLIYRSIAAEETGSVDVFNIIETSAKKNPARQITGFLIYDTDRFLQLIEGSALSLDSLMTEIEVDTRHHSLEVLMRSEADERLFPDWTMKRLITFGEEPALEELRKTLRVKPRGAEVLDFVNGFLKT